MKNKDNKQNSKILINGSYSILLTVLLLAGLIIVNLIVNHLPVKVTQFDFSNEKLYTLTDITTGILKNLDQDVELYYICEGGKEDDTIQKLLDRYESASSHIKVEQIDPALYPGFTSKYTQEDVANNSVIAVSGDVSKVVNADSMYVESMNYNTYSYVKTGFDGEGMITSAVDYVTAKDIPNLYILSGNGETALGSAFGDVISKDNVNPLTLNLMTTDKVPEDADAILINTPTVDYSEEEAQKIIDKRGLYPITVIQPQYNMVDRYIEHEIMGTCRKYGIGITSFSPLSQGLLTGKYKKGQPYPEGSRATHQADKQINNLLTDENLAIVDELSKVADDLGTNVAILSLAWILKHPEISCVIAGASKPSQLENNLKAVDLEIPDDAMERIEKILGFQRFERHV